MTECVSNPMARHSASGMSWYLGQMGNGLLDSSNGSIGDEASLTVNSPPPVDRTRIITAGALRASATQGRTAP